MRGAFTTAGVWAGCILPSACLNILPHAQALYAGSPAGAIPHVIMIAVKASFVIGMAYLPIRSETAETKAQAATCWLVWLLLATVCFYNALGGAALLRDLFTGPVRELQTDSAGLKSRIEELRKSRAQVPQHIPASAAMVEAARNAVKDAQTARNQECNKVGDNCRARVKELETANQKLADIEARRALTVRTEKFDAEIETADGQLRKAGYVPSHFDDAAARLAILIGKDEATVSEWFPVWLALAIEIWAALGAYCFLPRSRKAPEAAPIDIPSIEGFSIEPLANLHEVTPIAAPKKTAVRPSPATPAKSRKPKETKDAGLGDVREWHKSRILRRLGNLVRVRDAFEAYSAWCEDSGLKPVSLTAFGTVMKGDLGVGYIEKSKRGFYQDIALVSRPALVAVS